MQQTLAPYPLSEPTEALGDLVMVAVLGGPVAYLQAASWLLSDILLGIPHATGTCPCSKKA